MKNSRALQARTLGIIGGGQLARFLSQSAASLGRQTVILAAESDARFLSPGQWIEGSQECLEDLLKLAQSVDVITVENDAVDAGLLAKLEDLGHVVRPGSRCLRIVQDKLAQKEALRHAGIPVPAFQAVESSDDIVGAAKDLGWPLVLKARRGGYDGKGICIIHHEEEARKAWSLFDGAKSLLMVEECCRFQQELAVIVTRAMDGAAVTYPLTQTVQHDHICRSVVAPAEVPAEIHATATRLALQAAAAVEGCGSLGVEFFLMDDGALLLNEISPRVHNSGHFTLEACTCSQFENHIRAVLGWPLGETAMMAPHAAMVNILGDAEGTGWPSGLTESLAVKGAKIHLYGKAQAKKGRKMGHVTSLGNTSREALESAQRAASYLIFGA